MSGIAVFLCLLFLFAVAYYYVEYLNRVAKEKNPNAKEITLTEVVTGLVIGIAVLAVSFLILAWIINVTYNMSIPQMNRNWETIDFKQSYAFVIFLFFFGTLLFKPMTAISYTNPERLHDVTFK